MHMLFSAISSWVLISHNRRLYNLSGQPDLVFDHPCRKNNDDKKSVLPCSDGISYVLICACYFWSWWCAPQWRPWLNLHSLPSCVFCDGSWWMSTCFTLSQEKPTRKRDSAVRYWAHVPSREPASFLISHVCWLKSCDKLGSNDKLFLVSLKNSCSWNS